MAAVDGSAAVCNRQCAADVRASIASERERTGTACAPRCSRLAMPADRPPRSRWPRGRQQRTRQTTPPLPPVQPPQRIVRASTAPLRSSPTRACMPGADPDDHGRRGRDWGQAWRRRQRQRAERQRRKQLTGCRCAVLPRGLARCDRSCSELLHCCLQPCVWLLCLQFACLCRCCCCS